MKAFLKSVLFLSLIISVPLFFISCGEDEPAPPAVTVSADAGSDQTVNVGTTVNLDGSGSSSSDGSTLAYSWVFSTQPGGSAATLTGPATAAPSFMPDVAGDYILTLTVTSGTAVDTDQVTITAESVEQTATDIAGVFITDTVLEDIIEDPNEPDYFASGAVGVQAQLTINPGVRIEFDEDVMLTVSSGGAIIAEGSGTDSVIFTSSNVESGLLWKGIYINSASALNSFSIARVSYAGNSVMNFSGADFKSGIGVEAGAKVKVANTKLNRNDGYGLYIEDSGGELSLFADNVVENNVTGVGLPANSVASLDGASVFNSNGEGAVEIFGTTLADTEIATWPALSNASSYVVSGDLTIDGELTLAPGSNFALDENVLVTVNGAIIATGDAANRIGITTSDEQQTLLWKGFYIVSGDARNSFDFVDISYGGNTPINFAGVDFETAIGVGRNGKVSVTNSTFSNNQGYGLYVEETGGQVETFSLNTFEGNTTGVGLPMDEVDAIDGTSSYANNTQAAVEVFGSTYDETRTSTWSDLGSDAAYRITSNVNIDGELTLAPGVDIVLDEDVLVTVANTGALIADGTMNENITFNSSNVAGGLNWKGIYVISGSALNKFNYVVLSNSANSPINFAGVDFPAGVGVGANGKASVTNSTFTDNPGYGLYVEETGGQIDTFSDNTFSNNLQGVGAPADEIDAIAGNSTFSNNSQADVEIFATTLDVTKNVTWNALAGSATYRITGQLNIDGTLTIAPGAFFEIDEDVQIRVETGGALIADGTDVAGITFTSSNIGGGILWKGIYFLSSSNQNLIDHCEVAYGGNSEHNFSGTDHKANIAVNNGAVLTVTNSAVSNSGGSGIYSKGIMNDFGGVGANNTFTGNAAPNTQE